MRLLIVMTVIFQNGIIAVPNQPPEIPEQYKEQQIHIQRLETAVQKLEDENENFKRQIDGLIKSKIALYADIEDKMASQNDMIASRTETIDIMQEKLNGEFMSKQNELKSKIDETAASVEEMKNTPKAVVAFRATCAKNFPNDHQIRYRENSVIWKNIEYNIGSAYDASNGKFTCPYDGIYSFYVTSPQICADGHFWGEMYISVNGVFKMGHINRNNNRRSGISGRLYEVGQVYGVVKLSKGDTVQILMEGTFYYAPVRCHETYFQGHLIDLL